MVEEWHPVYCISRHSLVLNALVEIDPIIIVVSRRSYLLMFGFLQGYIWLSALKLVEVLGPFLIAMGWLLPVNVDPTGCRSATIAICSIRGISVLTHRWRSCLYGGYSIFLATATVQLLVSCGLYAYSIRRQMRFSSQLHCSPIIYLLLFGDTTG